MKKKFMGLLAVLLASVVCQAGAAAAPGTGAVSPAALDQPRMQAARTDLEAAKTELQHAEHNKGGHRVNAIGFINAAISAVNRGIQFDRRHNHAQSSAVLSNAAAAPDQPHMRAALTNLENAKRNLEAATADKGGYRKVAIDNVNKAINEVNEGLAAGN